MFFLVLSLQDVPTIEIPGPSTAAPLDASRPPVSPALPAIRLEHQLIEVPAAAPRPPVRRRVEGPQVKLAAGSGGDADLITRARRAFVGDGRYRPEPFPRLR